VALDGWNSTLPWRDLTTEDETEEAGMIRTRGVTKTNDRTG
jgi:hypothetical protein